ncbi:MAG: hypothetical protein M3279_12810 [Actinomycetota bacterium]|nr:hypothetical protein [Actinomycetota bacterium]
MRNPYKLSAAVFAAVAVTAGVAALTSAQPVTRFDDDVDCDGPAVRIEPEWWTEPAARPATPMGGLRYYIAQTPDLRGIPADEFRQEPGAPERGPDPADPQGPPPDEEARLVHRDSTGRKDGFVDMERMGESWIVESAAFCVDFMKQHTNPAR